MILVAEANVRRRVALARMLKESLQQKVVTISSARELIGGVDFGELDLMILNPSLPDLGSKTVSLLQKIRSNFDALTLPIVLLCDSQSRELVIKGMEAGANDILQPPHFEQAMLARFKRQVHFKRLHDQVKKQLSDALSADQASNSLNEVRLDLSSADRDLEQPIPVEIPLNLVSRTKTLFCKTIWVSYRRILLRVFEDLPREDGYRIEMADPSGGPIALEVVQTNRQANEENIAGVFNLGVEIKKSDDNYDRFFETLLQSQDIKDAIASDSDRQAVRVHEPSPTMVFSAQDVAGSLVQGCRYEFQDHLGRGSFASVFLVEDRALKRPVAMKVLNHNFATADETRRNFLEEAQIAAQFHHPNIVFVFEVGEIPEKHYSRHLKFPDEVVDKHPERLIYFTMQYVEGQTLTKWIGKKAHPEAVCLDILLKILKALSFAHSKRVIHRDIKPDNIMITPEDEVLVADFGIATLAQAASEPQSPDDANFEIACTPKYASPEQLTGESVDVRSDIYSFGIVAYELISGKAPFTGKSLTEIAHKQLVSKAQSFTEAGAKVSTRLEEIIFKCIEKKAKNRYQTADEILKDLHELKGDRTKEDTNPSAFDTLDELIGQSLVATNAADAGRVLERIVAFLRLRQTHEDVEELRQIRQKLTDPNLLNDLLEKNLAEENLQSLYEFFMLLESSSAVPKILRWFSMESKPRRKEFLGQLAILCAGEELMPLVAFGLELGDADARLLLRAFGEMAANFEQPIFLKWASHNGYQTQMELLKILSTIKRSDFECYGILDYFASGKGTIHRDIKNMAGKLQEEKAIF